MRVRLKSSGFLKGVVAIGGGTALAQAAAVLVSPLLTRLYTPEAIGLWGLFASYLGVASVMSTLRYEVAIVAARKEDEAISLTHSSLVLAIFTAILGAGVFELLRRYDLAGYGSMPVWAAPLVAVALGTTGVAIALRYYAVRKGLFNLVGRFTVAQGLAKAVLLPSLSFLGSVGLLVGEALGRVVAVRPLWKVLPSYRRVHLSLSTLVGYKSYPLVQLPSSMLNAMALMAPVPVFVSLYGLAVGGALALAQRVVSLPLSLIGAAVADVFYAQASVLARDNPGKLLSLFLSTSLRLGIASILLGVTLWTMAPLAVPLIFGREWAQAGQMMGVMGPWLAAQLAVSPVSRIVFLSRHAWVKLLYDLISVAIVLSPLWAWKNLSPVEAVLAISLSSAVAYALYFALLIGLVRTLAGAER